jgi:hypothetical protein
MRPHRTARRACALANAVLIAALAVFLYAAPADATPIGISDDGAMLAPNGINWAASQGVRDIRFQVHAGDLDKYDQAIVDADRHGMRVIVSPLHKPDGYPDFARKVAARWPQIDAISAYNEPEINGFRDNPCGYGKLYRDTRTAVRSVRKHLPVLFGELSPHGSFEWLKGLSKCKGRKVGMTHISFHPYQWATDPMSPKQMDSQDGKGDWLGIGRLPRVKRWLAQKSTMRAFGVRKPPKLWITEYGYLTSEATQDQITRWWPRAKTMADRLDAQTLVAQGAVTNHESRNWNSDLPTGLLAQVASS